MPPAMTFTSGTKARSSCVARTSSRATSTIQKRRPVPSMSTDGYGPATLALSTTTAMSLGRSGQGPHHRLGFNVFPAEVERVLNAHPGVVESGVVGVAHPHTGESVKAFVVPEPGRVLEEDDLIEWCATELARYKCPTKIDVVDEIPAVLAARSSGANSLGETAPGRDGWPRGRSSGPRAIPVSEPISRACRSFGHRSGCRIHWGATCSTSRTTKDRSSGWPRLMKSTALDGPSRRVPAARGFALPDRAGRTR